MSTLLYIEASPRKARSASSQVAKAFLDQYKAAHPADRVETIDLWAVQLPSFDGDTINAKYRILHGEKHTPAEAGAWKAVVETAERFKRADKYLFSLPMWNFGVPYRLKHYVDILIQPGLTFSFSPEAGYAGLVKGKPAAVVFARGGAYQGDDAKADFQKPYLELALGFIGVTDIRSIVVEPMLAGPEVADSAKQAAIAKAKEMAAKF